MSRLHISGRVIDVVRGEEFAGRVECSGGRIRRVVRLPSGALRGADQDRLILPGLVDAHIHIESSLLPPAEFARLAVTHGTVATVSDPHEIANVLGEQGVEYMLKEAGRSPLKFCFGAPSCVPATSEETAGAALDAAAVARLLARPDIGYLAEVMNYPAVLRGDAAMTQKLAAARNAGKPIDGHAPGLRGAAARAYAAAGITTDHECTTAAEAREKIRAGMKILIREGSAARNFDALLPVLRRQPEACMFCCDDLHPDLLVRRHIDEHVRRALAGGVDPMAVAQVASLNPVRHYRLPVGLLQPGDPADLIVARGWSDFRVEQCWLDGRLVARGGRSLIARRPAAVINRFAAPACNAGDFELPRGNGRARVIVAGDQQLITRAAWARGGSGADVLLIAVIDRYTAAARRAPAVALIRGLGLRRGAIASSVAHDSHNVIVAGASAEDMASAANAVIRAGGGLAVSDRGRAMLLPLPIAGLMATGEGRAVARRYLTLDRKAKALGSKLGAPFMTLSFMALLVIPDLKLSDRGLFSGRRWGFVPLWERERA